MECFESIKINQRNQFKEVGGNHKKPKLFWVATIPMSISVSTEKRR